MDLYVEIAVIVTKMHQVNRTDPSSTNQLLPLYLDKFVAQIIRSFGWQAVAPECLSLLTDLAKDLILKIGTKASVFAHHAGRATPSFYDVQCSISECGIDVRNIHLTRTLPRVPSVVNKPPEKPPTILKITKPLPQPSYIPDHLNHDFPQPHTYIKTPTYSMPVSSYSSLREARARQRNEVLNSLSRQVVNSCTSIQLIPGLEDCAWATPGTIDSLDYLITHQDDFKMKKKKRRVQSNNIYLQPPKCSWAGLFTS